MKKKIIKYLLLIIGLFIMLVLYLSIVGLKTEKFNNQIKKKITQNNNNIEIELKKIKLILDPLNFKINAKTIGANILYQGKNFELEYIKTQISLFSLIENKLISSNLELSTKSILLKDVVSFVRSFTNRPELFILEKGIKKGLVILNLKLNFDEDGNIKKDYKITGALRDGKIQLFKNYNFKKINFLLNIRDNIFNFKDIKFTTNKTNFFSDNLKITQNKDNFDFEGDIQNQNSILNNELLKLLNLNFKDLSFLNTNFFSKNKFTFNIDNKLKIKNLDLVSEIKINKSEYQTPLQFKNYFPDMNDLISMKDHKIKIIYRNNDLILEGYGKIKLEKNFDEVEYKITNKKKIFNLSSKINLSELRLKNQDFLKPFFPKLKNKNILKNQQIEINYNNNLSVRGSGKIKLENDYDDISFYISKIKDKLNFDIQINLDNTSFNIDFFNFKKDHKSKTQLKILGNYNNTKELNFNKISILEKNTNILLENILLDKNYLIIKVDKINLDYFDTQNKKNLFSLLRKQKNNYKVNGSLFNANKLINTLLKSKSNVNNKIFKSDINLDLYLKNAHMSEKIVIYDVKGKLVIKNNKVFEADISGFFDKNENLKFTINTNNEGEKITTLFSSRAKPIVNRYKFIKGYEEGYLDFYSSKKDNISKSKLKIYDFKLQELPALTKLLTLASLQGIADTLSGEGIRFNEFEMNFNNKGNLMTIDEIYAIGPAISVLMSGYVESDKLISLRGTLVPATTINKSIGSIPFLGKILVGDKAGEGVFGVSFKIKGPPKNLETTVNPIKTLTPRFITRTLEKIKQN